MVDDNEGLLREVEEELRRERLASIWQKYGTLIITGLALLVAGVGGWKYWQNKQIEAAQTAGMTYQSAMSTLENGKVDDAVQALETIAQTGPGGYQALARLQLAGAYLKQGKTIEAKAAFEGVAKDASDPLLKDFATLQLVALDIGDADLSDVQNRLTPFLKPNSPWRTNARELVALTAFRLKKFDVAKENLRSIVSDTSAAAGVIKRANTLLASIAAMELAENEPATGSSKTSATDTTSQPAAKTSPSSETVDKKSDSTTPPEDKAASEKKD